MRRLVWGSKLIMQIHHSPGGSKPDADLTNVQLRWTLQKPEYLLFTIAVGNFPFSFNGEGLMPGPGDRNATAAEFRIPANAKQHVESMQITLPPREDAATNPIWIYGVMAHEHLAGVDAKVDLERAGETQCLLQDNGTSTGSACRRTRRPSRSCRRSRRATRSSFAARTTTRCRTGGLPRNTPRVSSNPWTSGSPSRRSTRCVSSSRNSS